LLDFFVELIKKYVDVEYIFKPYTHFIGNIARRFRSPFYISLAIGFFLFIALSFIFSLTKENVKSSTYDFIIQNRLNSPAPSEDILIIDVDEKSIATLSPKIGRWPWPRSVLAEVIAGIEDQSPSVIYLNLLLAEKDLANKNSDNVLQEVLKDHSNIVIPWVRLNPANDIKSSFLIKDVPNFEFGLNKVPNHSNTIALIPSIFSDQKNHHGFSNLSEDEDGIIRIFDVRHEVTDGFIPSSVLVAANIVTKNNISTDLNKIHINWRNKHGPYKRISFSDIYEKVSNGEINPTLFKNKVIVIGLSAPGLANLKPTASSRLIDDNEIIANAIDDLISDSYLHLMPIWVDKLISITLIIFFCFAFLLGVKTFNQNETLGYIELVLVAVTLGLVSYTNYFINLTESIALSFSYYAFCKIYQSVDESSSRAVPFFNFGKLSKSIRFFTLIIFHESEIDKQQIFRIKKIFEKEFGVKNIYTLDNVFDGNNMLENSLNPLSGLLVFTESKPQYIKNTFNLKSTKFVYEFKASKTWFFIGKTTSLGLSLNNKKLHLKISKEFLKLSIKFIQSEYKV
jgi:CHASE2 domain-containing sensor protein